MNSLGLMNAFDPLRIPYYTFPGIAYPPASFPMLGFSGIGLSLSDILGTEFAETSFPGLGFSIADIPGLGYSGRGFPGYITPDFFTDSPKLVGSTGTDSNTTSQIPNIIDIDSLPELLKSLIPQLPVNPQTIQFPYIPMDLTSKMYVAATIEGLDQIIHILLLSDGQEINKSLEDIIKEGFHCIKVKNMPNVRNSYTINYGQECYTLSLYVEVNTLTPIWAWDCKWWQIT
jgi:hypothetical protein